jgi:hypothetical protein
LPRGSISSSQYSTGALAGGGRERRHGLFRVRRFEGLELDLALGAHVQPKALHHLVGIDQHHADRAVGAGERDLCGHAVGTRRDDPSRLEEGLPEARRHGVVELSLRIDGEHPEEDLARRFGITERHRRDAEQLVGPGELGPG